jgi:uncharacterized coiled-coil protein SlyX
MPDADIIVEKNWTNVIRGLRLGTQDGDLSDLRMYDGSGTNVVHLSPVGGTEPTANVAVHGDSGLLKLGGGNTRGAILLEDDEGEQRVVVGAGPKIRLSADDQATTLDDYRVDTHFVVTENLSASGEMSSQTGRIQHLELGGQSPSESYNQAGLLTVLNDADSKTVEIDGQDGSIRHTGGVTKMSDARAKQGVESVDGALDTVQRLEGVHFEWDDDAFEDVSLDDDRHVGFLAQDVEAVLPEAVDEDASGRLGTIDEAFTPVLVEAIKEQQTQIETQSETIAEQEDRIERQRDRISSLEDRLADLEAAVETAE